MKPPTQPIIVMIAATPYFADRGSHIRIFHEREALERQGWQVELFHYGSSYARLEPGASWRKIPADIALAWRVWKRVRTVHQPLMLYSHGYEAAVIAWWVKNTAVKKSNRAHLKIILDAQGSLSEEYAAYHRPRTLLGNIVVRIIAVIEKKVLKIPNVIVTSSEHGQAALARHTSDSTVIPDGFNPAIVSADAQTKRHAKQALDIDPDATVILYTGSMVPAKGVDLVLRYVPAVLQLLYQHFPARTVVFVFAGYGSLVEAYRNQYARLIASQQIIFLGRTPYAQLPAILQAADVAIDPKYGRSEGSAKLLQYLAAGLPTICFETPIPPLRPYVLFADPHAVESPEIFFKTVRQALTKPPPAVPAAVLTLFSWQTIAQQLIKLL